MKRPGWLRLPHRAAVLEAPVRWTSAPMAAAVVTGLVAAIAGVVSYSHITALGVRTYQGPADAHMLAIPIDGLIVAGSVILAAGSSLGWLGVALGVAATLFANLQFGLPHGALPAVVSTWPAVAFTVACFMLERWLRSRRLEHSGETGSEPAQSAQAVPYDSLDAAIQAMIATTLAGNPLSGRQLETRFGLKRPVPARVRELVLAGMNGNGQQAEGEAGE